MNRAKLLWNKRSLKDWLKKLAYRRGELARARREARRGNGVITAAEAERIRKWKANVAEAERKVNERRARIAKLTPKPAAGRQKAVKLALSHVGVRERYPNGGGIINTWQRRLGFGNVAWCGIFVGNMLMEAGVRGVTSRIAGVALIEDDAKAGRGPFTHWTWGTRGAKPGDLAVIGRYGQHVAKVVSVNRDGTLNTVEGNFGNAVRRGHRGRDVRGIAHVRFP